MIIDMILDRKEGSPYDVKEFYDYVFDEEQIFGFKPTISRALDVGTEKDVKKALCDYVIKQGYNNDICKYINSVNWLDGYSDEDVIDTETIIKNQIEDALLDKKVQAKVSEIFPKEFTDMLIASLQKDITKAVDDYIKNK